MKFFLKILFFLTFNFAFFSCENTFRVTPIPDVPVNLEVVILRDAPTIRSIGNFKIFNTPPTIQQRIGFGGILLYHNVNDEISAFDLACPVEAEFKILVDSIDELGRAHCRTCGSAFDLTFGAGNPVKTPAKDPLRRYRVLDYGDRLRVIK